MMKNVLSKLTFCILMFLSFAASAIEYSKDIFLRYTNYSLEYNINLDGTFVEDRSWSMQVLKDQALAYTKQTSINYSTSVQDAEVLEAYTLKADGKRVSVPKDSYQVTINGGKGSNQAIFSDRTTLTVVFPELAVGDTIVFHYKLIAKEAIFPNQFSATETYLKNIAYDDIKVRIDAPKSLKLRYDVREMVEEKNTIEKDRQVIVWTRKNSQPIISKRTDYSAYNNDEDPGFIVSTFSTHEEIAKAYGSRATPKAVVTERIKKLADEITKDKTSQDDIAHSLYDWVATNITYAGNCVGLGTVIPHDVDFILDNRMGDCKDHATLLQSLLSAKGIVSTQALINAGSAHKLPKIPEVSMINHVINYIPSMDLFLDSTAAYIPYHMLPINDQEKPVLLVDGFRSDMKSPSQQPGTNIQEYKSNLTINSDGSAKGESNINLIGLYAASARYTMRQISLDQEKDLVKNNFKGQGATATGEFTKDDPKALLDTYSYGAKYNVQNLYVFSKSGALSLGSNFFNFAPMAQLVGQADLEDFTFDSGCTSSKSSEDLTYEFPSNIKIISIPDDLEASNKYLTYTAKYKLEGNLLKVKRVFDDRTEGNVCKPEMLNENKKLLKKANENYKEQLIYKKIDSSN
jgi:transglutaminase-like putative cysteine protease